MVIERHPMGQTAAETAKQLLTIWRLPEETLLALMATAAAIPATTGESDNKLGNG